MLSAVDIAPPAAATAPNYGWDPTPSLLEYDNAVNASRPVASVDGGGNTTFAWLQFDGSVNNVWTSTLSPGGAWGAPSNLDTRPYNATDLGVASNLAGRTIVLWTQSDGTRTDILARHRPSPSSSYGSPNAIDNGSNPADSPQIAMDEGGKAYAVFRQSDASTYNTYANVYTPGDGWGVTPVLLNSEQLGDVVAATPQVAADAGGNATVVWHQWNGSRFNAWGNRFNGSAWGSATLLENLSGNVTGRPRVTATAAGNATAAWVQENGSASDLWARPFTQGAGWGDATLVSTNASATVYWISLAGDPGGNATLVWSEVSGGVSAIWGAHFTPAGGWAAPSFLASAGSLSAPVSVAAHAGGNATAVWSAANGSWVDTVAARYATGSWVFDGAIETTDGESRDSGAFDSKDSGGAVVAWVSFNGSITEPWMARHVTSSGWSSPALIDAQGGDVDAPQVALNPRGDAVAVWTRSDATRWSVAASRFTPGAGWGAPEPVESSDAGDATAPAVGIDDAGTATIAWQQWNGIRWQILARRHAIGSGWSSIRTLGANDTLDSLDPQLAVHSAGNVTVAWSVDGGYGGVWSARYTNGSGWESTVQVRGGGSQPRVAMRPSSDAILVFRCIYLQCIYDSIWSATYTSGTGWGAAYLIQYPGNWPVDPSDSFPDVAVAPTNNFTVAYRSSGGAVLARTWDTTSGWGSWVDISVGLTAATWLDRPRVANDASGGFVVVWSQYNGSAYDIFAVRYAPGSGWGSRVSLENSSYPAMSPTLGMDAGGNATVAWLQSDGTRNDIWAIRYSVGSGWGSAAQVEVASGNAGAAAVAVSSTGEAILTWKQSDGVRYNAWRAFYQPPRVPGPPEVSGASANGTQIAINWTPPEDTGGLNITSYRVYRGTDPNNTTWIGNTTNLTFNDTNLQKGQTFFYRVSAVNPVGEGAGSNASSAMVPRTLPTTPRNLSTAVGYATVLVNWTAPLDLGDLSLTAYSIYRGTSSGSAAFLTNVSGLALNFTDTNLTNGQAYFYRVSAVNLFGEGPLAAEINATPGAPPSAPTGLAGVFGNQSATLNWSMPADLGGFNVTLFRLYRGTSPNASVNLWNLSSANFSFTDTNLVNGQTYYYSVRAVNAFGNGTVSAEVAVTPLSVPTAPRNLTVGYGDGELYLNWTAPADIGGASVTQYRVYRGTASGGEALLDTNGGANNYTDSGLTNGQAYFYYVRPVNVVGEGPPSNEANNTPKRIPSQPLNLTTSYGNKTVFLNWSAPADPGGAPILRFEICRANSSGAETCFMNTTGPNATHSDQGLTNGQTYFYKVRAVNVVGAGALSAEVFETPLSVPAAPALLTPSYADSAAFLNWTGNSDTGGSPITGYRVFRGTAQNPTTAVANLSSTASSFADTNVSNGTPYYYRVTALNLVGQGLYSNEVAVTPRTRPLAPQNLTLTFGDRNITLTWSAPLGDGGASIAYYSIERGTSPGGTSWINNTTGANTAFLDTPLTNGQTYYYVVRAVNSEGAGPPSAERNETPRTVPDAPVGLAAQHGGGFVLLNWTVPPYNGSSPILNYVVYGDRTPNPLSVVQTVSAATFTYNHSGLNNGDVWYFRVAAVNGVGTGAKSAEINETPRTVPLEPWRLNTTAFGNGYLNLTWTSPNDTRGAPLLSFTVYRWNATVNASFQVPYNQAWFNDSGLRNGEDYNYSVSANNSEGEGLPSDTYRDGPRRTPDPPSGLSTSFGDGFVVVDWSLVGSDGGRPVIDLRFQWSSDNVTWPDERLLLVSDRSEMVSSLSNGGLYFFRVGARNEVGTTWSVVIAEAPARAPDAPTMQAPGFGDSTIFLNWSALDYNSTASNGGRPVTSLSVEWSADNSSWPAQNTSGNLGATTTSNAVGGLLNGGAYWFRVRVETLGGVTYSSVVSQRPARAPNAPALVLWSYGDALVSLEWESLDYALVANNGGRNITNLTVEWADTSTWATFNWSANLGESSTAFVVGALANGTPYWFRIHVESDGGSNRSVAVTQTPKRVPDAPAGLTALPDDRTIRLNWTEPYDGGAAIENYSVYRLNNTTSAWEWIANTTGLMYDDGGLDNGTVYTYRVNASNAAGEGNASNSAWQSPKRTPLEPLNVRATFGNRSVNLTWIEPSYNGSADISHFTVYGAICGQNLTAIFVTTDNMTRNYTHSNLVNGTTYCYEVTATNIMGESTRSLQAQERPRARPVEVGLTRGSPRNYGDSFVVIAWSPPYDDGGDAVVNYSVFRGVDGANLSPLALVNRTTLTLNDTGLQNGHVYCYAVRVNNTVNWSGDSNQVCEVPRRAPGPNALVNLTWGNRSIALDWPVPSDDGGVTVAWYLIYRGPTAGGESFLVNTSSPVASFVNAGLLNGQQYCYLVRAGNTEGAGPPSPSACAVPRTRPVEVQLGPGQPRSYGDSQVNLSWSLADDGGDAAVTYSVSRSEGGAAYAFLTALNNTTLILRDVGLVNGRTYCYVVVASNGVGASNTSNEFCEVPRREPGAIAGVSLTPGNGTAELRWAAPSDDGGVTVSWYRIYMGSDPGAESLYDNTTSPAATLLFANLTNGQQYCFRVSAGNNEGEGPATASNCTFPRTVPRAPLLLPVAFSDRTVFLHWTPDADTGGANLSGFWIYREGPGESFRELDRIGASAWNYTDTTVVNGNNYSYWVASVNVAGRSAFSNNLSVIPITVPTVPVQLEARESDHTVNLTWFPPDYDGSSPITCYEVHRGPSEVGLVLRATLCNGERIYNDPGLGNDVAYVYGVRAINERGAGAFNITIAVPHNLPPVLVGDPPRSIQIAPGAAFTFGASDPEGTQVEFSVVLAPPWIRIDRITGTLTMTPESGTLVLTPHPYTLRVTDRGGAWSDRSFEVFVGNTLPEIRDIRRDAKPNEPYTSPVNVTDDDGQLLTVSLANLSDETMALLANPWRLEWTPLSTATPGETVDFIARLTVVASDGVDTVFRVFQIRVRSHDEPPQINATFGTKTGHSGESITINLSGPAYMWDPDDPPSNLTWSPPEDPGGVATLVFDPANLTLTITFNKPGTSVVNLTLSDPSGRTHARTLTIESLGVAPAEAFLSGDALWASFLLAGLLSSAGALVVVQREIRAQTIPAYRRLIARAGRELTAASNAFRLSGALIAAGALVLFLEHLLLALANLTLVQGRTPSGTPSQPFLLAYLDQVSSATVLDVIGAAVLGFGLVLFGVGLRSLRWKARRSGETGGISQPGVYLAMAAGLLCITWVVLTLMWRTGLTGNGTGDWSAMLRGSFANPAEGSRVAAPDLSKVGASVASAAALWVVAGVVFLAAAVCFLLSGRELEHAAGIRVNGRPMVTLAIASLAGTVLLGFYGAGAATRAAQGQATLDNWMQAALVPLAIAGGAKLVAAPIIAAAGFVLTAVMGVRVAMAKQGRVYLSSSEAEAVERELERAARAPTALQARAATTVTVPAAVQATAVAPFPVAPAVAPAAPKGPTYLVETVFLLYGDGRAIFSRRGITTEGVDDPELVGSMLIAVRDFVKDSFNRPTPLDRMSYGDGSILIERGSHLTLAVTIFGEPDRELREIMREAVSKLEANYAGIIEVWDGDRGAFSGVEPMLEPLWLATADLTRGDVLLAISSREVQMISGAEFFQGYVRLKVGVVNNTTSVITGVAVDVDYNADVLRLHKVEPTGYKVSGTKVLLGVLNTGEKATVAYYFDPQICTSSMIDGLCRYKDADGKLHTVTMKSRAAEVVCPIFFTKEQANTAMLRRLVETQLRQFDLKAYALREGAQAPVLHELFEAMKNVVLAHDVVLVRSFERKAPFEAEAWFYGKTQKGFEIAIRVLVDGTKNRAEFFAASDAMKSVTGLLAEFHHQFEQAALTRFVELELRPLFEEALRAPYEDPEAVSRMVAGEIGAGETEQPEKGADPEP